MALSLIKMGKIKQEQVWGYQELHFRHNRFSMPVRHSGRLSKQLDGKV